MQIKDIIDIVRKNAMMSNLTDDDITDSTSLMLDGILDSLGFLNLVAEIEKRLGAKFPASMITMDNFQTVDTILTTANRLTSQ